MIHKDEIEEKSELFEISIPDVERDYVFGWLLCGIYSVSTLKDVLILKGGNGFRKGYTELTRYSGDLDFSTVTRLDLSMMRNELNKVCDFVAQTAGIFFEQDRIEVSEKNFSDKLNSFFQIKLYFKDFYGNSDDVTIRVKLDIAEFDRIYLPVQSRQLIHPYSDSNSCIASIHCVKLEEMLAAKLKCLLQRRHSFDLFDLVFMIFFNETLSVNKTEVVSTFLKKTIFGRSPGVAAKLLLGLPIQLFKGAWEQVLSCPKQSLFPFEIATDKFTILIKELFGDVGTAIAENFFYPSHLRNLILEAGSKNLLLEVAYAGKTRIVEPYSLSYKRRQDGHAEEYFYVWDRTGGNSSPGIKTLLNGRVESMSILEEKFEPRYPVELSKAGEMPRAGYFSKPSFGGSGRTVRKLQRSSSSSRFRVQCVSCGKVFAREKYDVKIRKHKDRAGNNCYGRRGTVL